MMEINGVEIDKQSQHFDVIPHSPITGGNAAYTADFVSGRIAYQANVVVKVVFFSQTKVFKGDYQVDPEVMLSSKMSKVGDSETIAGLTFTVVEVGPGVVRVNVANPQLSGSAILATDQKYLRLISLDGTGEVMGRSIEVQLQEAHLI